MAGEHDHRHGLAGPLLRRAVGLTVIILAVEAGAGFASHSLALLSDAGHVLTDLVALGLAWFAASQAHRPADARRTYGYHRTGILTALLNCGLLLVIVVVIAFEAAGRLQQPAAVTPWLMVLSAAIGIAVNLYIGFGLRRESTDNLNVRAAMLHVFGDVAASAAVIVAAGVIALTGWYAADPLLSLGIAALIAGGAWSILRETVDILMEAAPRNLDPEALVRDLRSLPKVEDVHDLHVWSIAGGLPVLSAHIHIAEDLPLSACDALQLAVGELLRGKYGITHTTIQFECAACNPSPLYCSMQANGHHDHAHVPLTCGPAGP